MMKYSWKSKLYTLISCLFFIGLWQLVAVITNNDIYIPRIQQVIEAIKIIFMEPDFLKVILSSFYRTIFSYILALVFSMILGVLGVVYPFFQYLIQPINSFAKTIPTMVLVVLLLVWFDKDITPFAIGFAIIFPILYEGVFR